ncbi:DUF4817 domain-containing protein [Trichonephila clavipes]|nr:DUF4817 domain-containing protein [Trichonephila clavipes]
MITNFFIPELNNHDVQEQWFQQNGATCHTARATIDLLKDTFGDHLISRFGHVNWPQISCDLTPIDYFLWGYVKSLVYADKPQTLDHLEDNIRRVIADIRPQMLEKVIENRTSRLDYIRASRGKLSLIRDFSRHVKHLPFPSEHTKGLQTRFGAGVGRGEINSKKLHLDLFTDTAEEEKNRELDLMHLLLSEVIYSCAEGIWKIILSNPGCGSGICQTLRLLSTQHLCFEKL